MHVWMTAQVHTDHAGHMGVCVQVHADMDACIRAYMSAAGVVHMHSLAYRGLTHVVHTWLQ